MRCYNHTRCYNSFVATCPFCCEESLNSSIEDTIEDSMDDSLADKMFPITRMDVVEKGTQQTIMNRLVSLCANNEFIQKLNNLMELGNPLTFGEFRGGNTIRIYFLKPEGNGTYTLYVGQRENEDYLC